ncbi:MAG: MarR family transcriptional regulator [Propionivibrio sp.]
MTESSRTEPADEIDLLRLENQLCFPLYATSRLVTRLYQPLLEPLGLTYPQYIVLMILWEDAPCPVSRISERALLNTNTLTPLLKRLEQLGFIQRQRRASDERVVEISLTPEGAELKARCACVPVEMLKRIDFPLDKAVALKTLLEEFLAELRRQAPAEPME